MIVLGIEGTAHTFGVGVVKFKNGSFEILSNVRDTFKPKEGLIPREVAEHHSEVALKIINQTLKEAGIRSKDVDLIAYSRGPGLPPCLRITSVVAKSLSLKYNKPFIGVNHASAHITIARRISKFKDSLVLYTSGGNTQIVEMYKGDYIILGESLDIALGNAIDKLARHMGLPFPGGPEIEKLAAKGKKYIELPYTIKGMDFSFSGVTTAAERLIDKGYSKEDVAFSFQETVFAVVVEAVERALAHTNKNELVVCGGVAANKRFREMISIMCKERGVKFKETPLEFVGDNGVMIAFEGYERYRKGEEGKLKDEVLPKWRLDEL